MEPAFWWFWPALLLFLLAVQVDATSTTDDETLVSKARQGDRKAFNQLIGRYQGLVYNIAYRLMGNGDGAADAAQEAFLSAYRRLDSFHGGSFKAWIARIVTNQCYDMLRHERRRPTVGLDPEPDEPDGPAAIEPEAADRPDETFLQAELAGYLERIIGQLPLDQRTTLVLSDVHGLSYEEIGAAMGVELGTVKSRLNRARRKVRDLLQSQAELLPARYRSVGGAR